MKLLNILLEEPKNAYSIKKINIVYTEEGQHYKTTVDLANGDTMDIPRDMDSEELSDVLMTLNVYTNPEIFTMDYEADSSDRHGNKDLNKLDFALNQAGIELDIDRIDVS